MGTYPLFISAVNYAKDGLISVIYAKSSFGAQAMILTRVEMMYLIKEHSQLFYIDERSYSFKVSLLRNGFLSNHDSEKDSLGTLKSLSNQLGEISAFEKGRLAKNAQTYLRSLGAVLKNKNTSTTFF